MLRTAKAPELALAAFRLKPEPRTVVLWSHLGVLVPIGRAVKTWKDGKRVLSTVQFAPADANPQAEEVRKLVSQGYLGAASIGFVPTSFDWSSDKARPYGLDIKAATLLEWSACFERRRQVFGNRTAPTRDRGSEGWPSPTQEP